MNHVLGIILAIALLAGCADRDKQGNVLDTPTSGTIIITVDESLRPLIEAEIDAFEGLYQHTHIKARYTSEQEAIEMMLMDSARASVVTRRLAGAEEQVLHDQKIVSIQLTLATGGVALIVNRQNPDTLIQLRDIKSILKGKVSRWSDLNKTASALPLKIVFDLPNSGIIRYLQDSVGTTEQLPENCFAVKGNRAVVDYISHNRDAIGLIDVSWISDRDDSTANSFLNSIRVMGVSCDSVFYQPYQAYIAQGLYPLRRDIVIISREARAGLASGFMAFLASEKGQRIVLKSGLVPATMPVRIVEVNHEPI